MGRAKTCSVCGRKAGSTADVAGWEPRQHETPVPLGQMERCKLCKRWACPDCLHEADCCFDDEEMEKHYGPMWAPPGWVLSANGMFTRKQVTHA